jgi:hypothetical protein
VTKTTRRFVLAVAVLGLVVGAAGQARADLVTHAYADTPNDLGPQSGLTYARSDLTYDRNDRLFIHAEGFAEAGEVEGHGLTPQSLTRFATSVEMSKQGGVGAAFETNYAHARWDDRFLISTSVTDKPIDLAFQFSTRGVMSVVQAYSLGLDFRPSINPDRALIVSSNASFGYGYAVGKDELLSSGFDKITFMPTIVPDEIGYEGLVTLRFRVNGSNGTIGGLISLDTRATVEVADGVADGIGYKTYIDSSHSSGIQSILVDSPTLGLVTPESLGWTVSFDSGLSSPNIMAVPEPSSLALCGIAGVVGLVVWKRLQCLLN